MASSRSSNRNHRNNPYVLDGLMLQVHHSAAGVIWRFRAEVIILTATGLVFWQLELAVSIIGAGIVIAASTVAIITIPPARRFMIGHAWCVHSRHRMQRMFFETRMHTRSGRIPLVLRIHPTEVGERALIWCRAGTCFEDFEAHTGEIAAACYAREARIERSKRWAQLVQVNVVRRDTLAPHNVIASGLASKVPAARDKTTVAAP